MTFTKYYFNDFTLDVVAAYKGLLKEKEALEASLHVLSTNNADKSSSTPVQTEEPSQPTPMTESALISTSNASEKSQSELENQIATMMNSLATLSAEKSKMEASFQADRKSMRSELKIKEKIVADLQEKVNSAAAQIKLEVEKVKSKLIIERHEWEKGTENQMSMIRELQKLLNDERQLRESVEMQLSDMKQRFSQTNNSKNDDLAIEVEKLRNKIKDLQKTENDYEQSTQALLPQMQIEMMNLKRQHAAAIQLEQLRASRAEERSRSLAALHEERVANLENRLAELSTTVGTYDRLRQLDQENIIKLKEKILQLDRGKSDFVVQKTIDTSSDTTKYSGWTVNEILNEILLLKNLILLENSKLETPIDVSRIYGGIDKTNDKCDCTSRCESLLNENKKFINDIERLNESIETYKFHIKNLQSKVEVLNRNIDEQEQELRNKNQEHKNDLHAERMKWKEIISNTESDYRMKQSELELQLQKQRERSLKLLEEKENEIKIIKSMSDGVLVSTSKLPSESSENYNRRKKLSSSSSSHVSVVQNESDDDLNLNQKTNEMHLLHYVHELSRKDVEITALRKTKHLAEQTLRQALQDKAASQEELYEKISLLEEQVDRLERCKSREGANLEYLKNVILSFLATNDIKVQRHMINAISAVLKFSPSEMKTLNSYFNKNDSK